jgi:hypothetical protein
MGWIKRISDMGQNLLLLNPGGRQSQGKDAERCDTQSKR